MPFSLTRDLDLFRKFYEDEKTLPKWFQESSNNWGVTWDDFKAFCDKCERIYQINRTTLIYVERIGGNGNLHFSQLRGYNIHTESLRTIRDALLTDYDMLFAWIGRHNRGLKSIVEQCGMTANSVEMRKGQSHGKVLVWQCYTVTKNHL